MLFISSKPHLTSHMETKSSFLIHLVEFQKSSIKWQTDNIILFLFANITIFFQKAFWSHHFFRSTVKKQFALKMDGFQQSTDYQNNSVSYKL